MLTNRPLHEVSEELDRTGYTLFFVQKDNGHSLAQVVLEGDHRITLRARVMGRNGVIGVGYAEMWKKDDQIFTDFEIGSAFGTAYARAVNPELHQKQENSVLDGTIERGDFVEATDRDGSQVRGIVADTMASRGRAVYLLLITAQAEDVVALAEGACLIAKGV